MARWVPLVAAAGLVFVMRSAWDSGETKAAAKEEVRAVPVPRAPGPTAIPAPATAGQASKPVRTQTQTQPQPQSRKEARAQAQAKAPVADAAAEGPAAGVGFAATAAPPPPPPTIMARRAMEAPARPLAQVTVTAAPAAPAVQKADNALVGHLNATSSRCYRVISGMALDIELAPDGVAHLRSRAVTDGRWAERGDSVEVHWADSVAVFPREGEHLIGRVGATTGTPTGVELRMGCTPGRE